MTLSADQLDAIEITTRVASTFSVFGTVFVIVTFLASSAFHKPINRLVFYAAWGNLITNVATLIARSGIRAGVNAPLCQMQSFIIQMFMPADSLWTLAMACNVYLTFFHRFSASQLRALEWKYVILCYGIPFIPAIVFVLIGTEAKGKIFGSAVLWCWITVEWNNLRIALFYGPVWVILVATMLIYARTGNEIYKRRRQLRNFSAPRSSHVGENLPMSSKTTEVRITSQSAEDTPNALPDDEGQSRESFQGSRDYQKYTVNIESTRKAPADRDITVAPNLGLSNSDKAAWAYTKCALLFFAALLITWVPSTINRVYTLVYAGADSFPLNYTESLVLPLQGFWNAVIYIATSIPACRSLWQSLSLSPRGRRPAVPHFTASVMRTKPRNSEQDSKSESMIELAHHQ